MKTQPTYILDDGEKLIGKKAKSAWVSQDARCNCNAGGDPDEAVHGTCSGLDAIWLGCPYCPGTAVGRPLVFRKI